MNSTSGESLKNGTYKNAEQIGGKSENRTNWTTADLRTTQVIQTEHSINLRVVPESPRLRTDQRRTD